MELIGRMPENEEEQFFKFVRIDDIVHITSSMTHAQFISGRCENHDQLAMKDGIFEKVDSYRRARSSEVDAGFVSINNQYKRVFVSGNSSTLKLLDLSEETRQKTALIFKQYLPENYEIIARL